MVDDPFEAHEVWFLTGSQGLYGEETLQQVAEQSHVDALYDRYQHAYGQESRP